MKNINHHRKFKIYIIDKWRRYLKNNNKKQEKIININMNENEEMVYSQMGLDPILLLENLHFLKTIQLI